MGTNQDLLHSDSAYREGSGTGASLPAAPSPAPLRSTASPALPRLAAATTSAGVTSADCQRVPPLALSADPPQHPAANDIAPIGVGLVPFPQYERTRPRDCPPARARPPCWTHCGTGTQHHDYSAPQCREALSPGDISKSAQWTAHRVTAAALFPRLETAVPLPRLRLPSLPPCFQDQQSPAEHSVQAWPSDLRGGAQGLPLRPPRPSAAHRL
jgi:hypothetical protein